VTCVQLRHQPLFTAHILRAMAIADFITSGAAVLNGALIASIGGFVCDLTAILYWYGAWASWMWMAGYAFAINRCMRGAFVSDSNCATPVGLHVAPLTHRVNGALHAACWGVPSLLVVAVYLQSDAEFGPTDDVPSVCAMTTQTEEAFLFFTAMLWLVIAYGLWIFARIQWRLCRSVTAATADMAPSVRQAAFRRVTMWPQFLAYIVVFLVSQAPGVVVSSFNWEIPKWLEVLVSALANLHGMLNAVTYGCTNAEVYVNWLPSGFDGFRTGSGGSTDEPLRMSFYQPDAALHGILPPPPPEPTVPPTAPMNVPIRGGRGASGASSAPTSFASPISVMPQGSSRRG